MADSSIESMCRLTSEMVKIPSVTSNIPAVAEVADLIKEWLGDNGIKARIKEFNKGAPMVIAEAGSGKKSVMINGHMDVVPEGDRKRWSGNPYSGRIDKNGVHGRGAVDMKSGLAVLMHTFAEVADKVDYRLVFTAVADEEIGGYMCAKPLAEEYSPEVVLVGEPTGSKLILLAEKGVYWSRLRTKGKTAHASTPSRGVNAIMLMTEDLRRLSSISKRKVKMPKGVGSMLKTSIREFGRDMPYVSFNAGMISGGLQPNVVPDACEATIDMRLPPGIDVQKVLGIQRSMARNSTVEVIVGSNPSYTDPSNRHASKFVKVARSHARNAKTAIMSGGTDGRFFRYKGIPSITFGPGDVKLMHNYNECVPLNQLETAHHIYRDFLLNLSI